MADTIVTAKPGERFRRVEVVRRLRNLADLLIEGELPVHRFDRTPLLEFHLGSEEEVDRVAHELGQTPKRCGREYFTGIENAELRVRWTAQADSGLGYSREADDPTPVSPARVPLHTGAVTDDSLTPKPIAEHYDATSPDADEESCACGATFGLALDLQDHITEALGS